MHSLVRKGVVDDRVAGAGHKSVANLHHLLATHAGDVREQLGEPWTDGDSLSDGELSNGNRDIGLVVAVPAVS